MSKFLSSFYYLKNNQLDPFTLFLSSQNVQLYFLLGASAADPPIPPEVFLHDLTVSVTCNGHSFHDVSLLEADYDPAIFDLCWHNGRGGQQQTAVEERLNQGNFVPIQTSTAKTPFLRDFGDKRTDHTFLLVGHDPDHFYYVESPWLVAPEKFQAHPQNRSVGIVKKRDMAEAFDEMLNHATVTMKKTVDELDETYCQNRIIRTIVCSTNNAGKQSSSSGEITTHLGPKATELLLDEFRMLSASPETNLRSPNLVTLKNFHGKTAEIARARGLLLDALKKRFSSFPESRVLPLTLALEESYRSWQQVTATFGLATFAPHMPTQFHRPDFQRHLNEIPFWETRIFDAMTAWGVEDQATRIKLSSSILE